MDYLAALKAPFKPEEIEWRVGQETKSGDKVSALAYLTSRAVQQRLDDVFGVFGWSTKYLKGPDGGVLCELSCRSPEGEWVTKSDGSPNTDIESVKGGLSSALKRAAVHWGVGRYLYDLPMVWCPLKPRGENYHRTKARETKYWDSPKLPIWALPKGDPIEVSGDDGGDEWREAIALAPDMDTLTSLATDLATIDLSDQVKAELRKSYTKRIIELKGTNDG